ncbi:hypothetical protein ACFVIM_23995 [Streptomyces sp. NPDC057638]|uniref:hypothetical protein n=1 Tax=Streptomyces sp. NPDC057638 TaxID=3346190 RepID=UPI0036A7DE3A
MGWTVLYVAFGIVALWLLGEVLLQYKARLRWRLLAFGGFLGVVLGVLIPSVVVIGVGAIAFAVGQTYVTLSFRSGFATGWSLKGGSGPGTSRRRKGGGRDTDREPALEVSAVEETMVAGVPPLAAPGAVDDALTAVYEPQPLPDDTAGYGVYSDAAYDALQGDGQHGAGQHGAGQDHGQPHAQPAAAEADPAYGAYDPGYYGQGNPLGVPDAPDPYGYGTGQQQFAAYSDPYVGGQQYGSYENYDSFGNQQPYTPDAYGYGEQGLNDTPPGGVWVPHQRDTEQPSAEEQPPYGYDPGRGDQQQPYRY